MPGQVQNSSGSGSAFRKSSGSGLIGFDRVCIGLHFLAKFGFGFIGFQF